MYKRIRVNILCFTSILSLITVVSCEQSLPISRVDNLKEDLSHLKSWSWENIQIPLYTWPMGTAFGEGLYVDVAFDNQGVQIKDGRLVFSINPLHPLPPQNPHSEFNFRNEIRTAPWNIEHPLGTEQWIGWSYTFPEDYQVNLSEPLTIYQNHPGIEGESPQFELEIAAKNRPRPAQGGEIQVVNNVVGTRDLSHYSPRPWETYNFVVHVVYGGIETGLLQVWINDEIVYDKQVATVYSIYPWGGNNKWGLYHHSLKGDSVAVSNTLDQNITKVVMNMGQLNLLTRHPDFSTYLTEAYDLIRPE